MVENLQPAKVQVYDYYNPGRKSVCSLTQIGIGCISVVDDHNPAGGRHTYNPGRLYTGDLLGFLDYYKLLADIIYVIRAT